MAKAQGDDKGVGCGGEDVLFKVEYCGKGAHGKQ